MPLAVPGDSSFVEHHSIASGGFEFDWAVCICSIYIGIKLVADMVSVALSSSLLQVHL